MLFTAMFNTAMKKGVAGKAKMQDDKRKQAQHCLQCANYYITHDIHFMYGCRVFQIKSKRQPILDVVDASGDICQGFKAKPERQK